MNRWAVAAKNAPLILRGIYEYNIASRFGPLPAREWLFPLTYRCDARCVMCNIWQSGKGSELSLEEWDQVLNDRLFAGIESVALSGGEPTLHPHLPQLAGLLLNRLPSLRRVTITTNGLNTERVVRQCAGLLELCAKQGIGLFAGISLDGLGEVHDRMRNIPEAFAKVQNTVQELQSLRTHGLRLGISCTLTSRNLHDAENVGHWAEERGLPVNYIVASFADSYYDNTECADELAIRPDQQEQLLSLLYQLGSLKSPGNLAAYFYADAAAMAEKGIPRRTPCIFQKDGFILDARGDLQYCMYSQILGNVRQSGAADLFYAPENLKHRRQIIAEKCGKCTITCFLELGLAKDAFRYIRFLLGGRP